MQSRWSHGTALDGVGDSTYSGNGSFRELVMVFPGATVINMSVASKKVTLPPLGTSNNIDTGRMQSISPSFT